MSTSFNLIGPQHPRDRLREFEEHGQTWVECLTCGAQWSINGDNAEQVTEGDGYCDERSAEHGDDEQVEFGIETEPEPPTKQIIRPK